MKKIRFKLSTEKVSALIFFVFAILFPMYSTLYQVDNFSNFYITVFVSFSIVLIWGFTGIFSFGQAAFYGMGAYTYAILSKAMGHIFHTRIAQILNMYQFDQPVNLRIKF